MKIKQYHRRTYYRMSKAYFKEVFQHENIKVALMLQDEDESTMAEFEIEWHSLKDKLVPRLQVFDDGWYALLQFQDLLERMAEIDDQTIQEPEFCELLESLGIVDVTKYEYLTVDEKE